MDSVLWYVLPLAAAIALSVFPVLAVVLLLLSKDPARASIAYALGWLIGVVLLVALFAGGAGLIPTDVSETMPWWVHYAEVVVGAGLIVTGIVAVVRERRRSADAEPPRWLLAARELSPRRAFVFGLLMNLRLKNLALTLAAGIAIGGADIDLFGGGVAVALFSVVGVSTVAGLVVAFLLSKERVGPLLEVLNRWLTSNASFVLKISVAVIGALLMGIGLVAIVNRF